MEAFGVSRYFTHITGLDNNQAKGKDDLIPLHLSKINVDANDILLVGDTDHDLLVANKIGCRCVLVADGHQSLNRLKRIHSDVIDDTSELLEYIKS